MGSEAEWMNAVVSGQGGLCGLGNASRHTTRIRKRVTIQAVATFYPETVQDSVR